jgi:hypothetical protein
MAVGISFATFTPTSKDNKQAEIQGRKTAKVQNI